LEPSRKVPGGPPVSPASVTVWGGSQGLPWAPEAPERVTLDFGGTNNVAGVPSPRNPAVPDSEPDTWRGRENRRLGGLQRLPKGTSDALLGRKGGRKKPPQRWARTKHRKARKKPKTGRRPGEARASGSTRAWGARQTTGRQSPLLFPLGTSLESFVAWLTVSSSHYLQKGGRAAYYSRATCTRLVHS
jgi:hypothetical protein